MLETLLVQKQSLAAKEIIVEFNLVCMEIGVVAFLLFIGVIYASKKISDKVSSDILGLKSYLRDINAKEYESVIKIEHYVEFLEISVLLKNIVKRLKQKEKK